MSRVGAIARADSQPLRALRAAGATDPGTQRDVNEDRFHCHAGRGLFLVIDGVGGQAAGGKAADLALSLLRERLERETGPVAERIREAITIANNEVHRIAASRSEWQGMACVLTAAVVDGGTATFGHVGDTRLYKLRGDVIEKLTRDHSPVGEREDANELSELQAMRHPRRNEVYRDVGSEQHALGDGDFIDVGEVPFEDDAALLLCSDGLTDLVDSRSIARIVREYAGDPAAVVQALIAGANAAGGKDNVTAVYVEGERFAADQSARSGSPAGAGRTPALRPVAPRSARRRAPHVVLVAALATTLAAAAVVRSSGTEVGRLLAWPAAAIARLTTARITVGPSDSIAAALRDAPPGSEILVEPGEYREQIVLRSDMRLVSRVPRGAVIRLPAAVRDADALPAVVARHVSGAALVGFVVSGDAATPLAIGIRAEDSAVTFVDVEVTGATTAAVEFGRDDRSLVIGGDIRDNPGAAMVVHEGASPRISHTAFARNGTSEPAAATLLVRSDARPTFWANVFVTANPESYATLDAAAFALLRRDNWFVLPPLHPHAQVPAAGRPSSPR